MEPQTPPPTDPQPSVDDLELTTPGSEPTSAGGVIQPTQSSAEAPSFDDHESLDLSQLDPPVTSATPDEPLVKPAPPVQPRSVPAFMQQPDQQSSTTTTTNTVRHNTYATAPGTDPRGNTAAPSNVPQPQAPFGPPPEQVITVKKSRLPLLIIFILVILLLAGGAAAAFFLTKDKKNNTTNTPTTSDTTQTDQQSTTPSDDEAKAEANATVAKSLGDFKAVCSKGSISNAAEYTSNKSAVIYEFHNSPATPDYWSSDAVGSGKSYYPDTDYQKISVVACLTYIDGSPSTSKDCDYKDNANKTVTIKYTSTKYSLAFYEAKTGKLISEGDDINGPATSCPSFITYDQDTKVAYARPDTNAVEAAFDTFVK